MDMKTRIAQLLADTLRKAWPQAGELPQAEELRPLLEVPPEPKLGDYAFPCFRFAKTLRMAPPKIAQALAEAFDAPETASVQAVNGYLNFFLNRVNFARDALESVLAAGEKYGATRQGEGKTICLDYSSINIAKRFHIGHLSTTMIGHSLKRIYKFLGYTAVGVNHLGDWGTQFGKMICAYKHWGDRETVEHGGVNELVRLYVNFHKEAEKDPALEDEGRAWFKKIEDGDEEALSIFNWFKEVTLKDAQKTYELLGVTFDSYAGESFYNDKMGPIVEELKEKGLLKEAEGAIIVDLEPYGMPPALILRSDGATLYLTRDLAAAKYRKDTYNFDKSPLRGRLPAGPALPPAFQGAGADGLRLGQGLRPRGLRHGLLRGPDALHPRGPRGLSGRPAPSGHPEGARHHRGKEPRLGRQGRDRPPDRRGRGGVLRALQQPHQGHRLLVGSRPQL